MRLGNILPTFNQLTNILGNIYAKKEQGWIILQTSAMGAQTRIRVLLAVSTHKNRDTARACKKFDQAIFLGRVYTRNIKPAVKLSTTQNEHVETFNINITSEKKPLKASSPNILKGVVTEIINGLVNS